MPVKPWILRLRVATRRMTRKDVPSHYDYLKLIVITSLKKIQAGDKPA